MSRSIACALAVTSLTVAATWVTPSSAAVRTDCLCRTADGKGFKLELRRHHRWACDYHMGYAAGGNKSSRKLPSNETCNDEEITQFRVYLCMTSGCTYPYAGQAAGRNRGLEKIKSHSGPRRP